METPVNVDLVVLMMFEIWDLHEMECGVCDQVVDGQRMMECKMLREKLFCCMETMKDSVSCKQICLDIN